MPAFPFEGPTRISARRPKRKEGNFTTILAQATRKQQHWLAPVLSCSRNPSRPTTQTAQRSILQSPTYSLAAHPSVREKSVGRHQPTVCGSF